MAFQGPQPPYPFPGHPHLMNPQDMSMKQMNATLYIGDIDDQLNEGMLYQFFIKYGAIYSVRIMRDVYNQKKSRGFGYVTYYSPKDAEGARINANHEVILKRPIRVTWKKNFRELDKEANVYIRNISKEVNVKDVDSYFSKYGAIFSSKIALDDNCNSLGYGYVQFEKKEQAEACLQEGEIHKVKGYDVKVERFQPSKVRDRKDLRNNLYIKNLPSNLEGNELEQRLREILKPFGEIGSLCVRKDEKINKFYSFCCFQTNAEATKCLTALNEQDPFNTNEKLYITYAEKKETRMKKLRESFANIINETNLFTKNLKKEVTQSELMEMFSKFGEITSCAIKEINSVDPKFPCETNCAFICFGNRDHAKKALGEAPKDVKIQELYKDKVIYLTYHYRKEQYKVYKEMKRRTMARYFSPQMNPMFIPFPMPPPMFGNQFFGAPGFNPYHPMMNSPHPPPMPHRYHASHSPEGGYNRGGPQQKRGGGPYRKPYDNKRGGGQRPQKVYQKHEGRPEPAQAPHEETQPESFTIQHLKEKLPEFLGFPQEKQRTILGELLFPLVQKHVSHETLAPKVTGMLIDFSVFEVGDIVEFLDNSEILHERVQEAEGLIQSTSG